MVALQRAGIPRIQQCRGLKATIHIGIHTPHLQRIRFLENLRILPMRLYLVSVNREIMHTWSFYPFQLPLIIQHP